MVTSLSMMPSSGSRSPPPRSRSRPRPPPSLGSRAIAISLEVQAAFAGGVGQGLDPAMIQIGTPVEDDLLDAGGQRPFRDQLAYGGRGSLVSAGFQFGLQGLV